ncbi:hypothetical protein E4U32_003004 [Claviceps aff. humidiphila group G2b]|nr:hypothetical protein E4U32_003004 [Claviceps aff. humidiphila group G2b]
MSGDSTKRIAKEYAECAKSPPPHLTLSLPNDSNLHTWHITYVSPPESPFHPGRYGLILTLPPEYPFKPPLLRFVTRIYHPNVTNDDQGNVCLAMLKPEAWKPSLKLKMVLEMIRQLMVEPQAGDPMEPDIAAEYREDRARWGERAQDMVRKYAMREPDFQDKEKGKGEEGEEGEGEKKGEGGL